MLLSLVILQLYILAGGLHLAALYGAKENAIANPEDKAALKVVVMFALALLIDLFNGSLWWRFLETKIAAHKKRMLRSINSATGSALPKDHDLSLSSQLSYQNIPMFYY